MSEVLITLGIIGVVAALTMPSLIANIQDKVFETQRKAAASKLSQALTLMNVEGKLEASFDTDTFVENLKSYLKIVQVCEKSDLKSCFPEKVSAPVLKFIDQEDVKEMTHLNNIFTPPAYAMRAEVNQPANDYIETKNMTLYPLYSKKNAVSNLKGVVTADGTSMLIGYAHGCSINPSDGSSINQSNQSNQGVIDNFLTLNILDSIIGVSPAYAEMGVNHQITVVDGSTYPETTVMPISRDERACVVAMIDVNTAKKPNKLDKDVFYYQATNFVAILIE